MLSFVWVMTGWYDQEQREETASQALGLAQGYCPNPSFPLSTTRTSQSSSAAERPTALSPIRSRLSRPFEFLRSCNQDLHRV